MSGRWWTAMAGGAAAASWMVAAVLSSGAGAARRAPPQRKVAHSADGERHRSAAARSNSLPATSGDRGGPPRRKVAHSGPVARHPSLAPRTTLAHHPQLAPPPATLAVWTGTRWQQWWRADRAPARWTAPLPALTTGLRWTTARPGLDWTELRLSGSGEAWRIRAIVVRIDPQRLRFALHTTPSPDHPRRAGPWTVDRAPDTAALALNAGQFSSDGGPWGWVVHRGRELRPPGYGPLAPALVVDSAGRVRLVPHDSIAVVRSAGTAVEAFQSYPALLDGDGTVPRPLADSGLGVDLAHRDARLAIGETRDGHILVVLTRFEGLGGTLDALPFGLTVPESAALLGALGARRAVALDGGISGQLLIRDAGGDIHAWRGLRRVALGLIATPRPTPAPGRPVATGN